MARTKRVARQTARTEQEEVATFKPREMAQPPNSIKCPKCDRRFSNNSNLARHERQTHGKAVFKYPCPVTPSRMFARRDDLRNHYRQKHPEADIEEIDDFAAMEVRGIVHKPTSSAKRSGAEESSGAANSAKKLRQTKTTVTVPNLEDGERSAAILDPEKIEQVAPGSSTRLMKIEEKVTIERGYIFEKTYLVI